MPFPRWPSGPDRRAAAGGVHALVKWLAKHAAPSNVLVTGVGPASVETPMMDGQALDFSRVPLGRMAHSAALQCADCLLDALVEKSRIPIVLASDRDAIRAAVSTSWSATDEATRMCVIRSTLHLGEALVSEPLLDELRASPLFAGCSEPFDLDFTPDGRLLSRAYADDEAVQAAS